jgi:uncharacterized protein with beta-barrel porin domain
LQQTLLATSSALALLIAAEGSAAAQCFYNNVNGGVDNTSPHNCISYNNGTAFTGNAVNDSTLTASHAYPPVNPGTSTGISVFGLGTTLTGNIVNNGTITASQYAISIGAGATTGGATGAGASLVGSITNNGTINGGAGDSIVVYESSITGSILNALGATINGVVGGVGINVTGGTALGASIGGSVINDGLINATSEDGIFVQHATVTGSIVNTGTIDTNGGSAGIVAARGSVGGSVTNSGTINAKVVGIDVNGQFVGGSVGNIGGTINAQYGIGVTGQSGLPAVITGNVANTGTINASAYTGIAIYAYLGGATVGGSVLNSGTINATVGTGIGLYGASVTTGITNSGTITAHNVGILISNTTAVVAGAATITGGLTNQGTINAATGIVVNGGSTLVGGITNTGTGTINGSVAAINLTGEGGPTTIDIDGGVVTGNIIGGGADTINFAPSGTFTYNSSFSAVSAVNVNSGTVVLNGTANSATTLAISSGGTLAGTGTISTAMTIMNGGIFAPGTIGTPGTAMHVTGGVTFDPTATYRVYLNPTTASLANISGTATLGNATVNAVFSGGSYVAKQYLILTSGGLVGTFNPTIMNSNEPIGGSDSLSYMGNNVYLNLTSNYGGGGLSGNQQAVANALTAYFNAHGGIPAQFFGLTPAQLTQLDGELGTGAQTAGLAIMSDFLNLLLDPSGDGNGGTGGTNGTTGFASEDDASLPPDVALAYAHALKKPTPQQPQAFDQRWSAWASGFGGTNTTDGNATVGSNNVTTTAYGYAGGLDYRPMPGTVYGVALGGGGTNWNLAQGLGSGRSDALQLGLYGTTHYGPAYLSAAVAFTNNWFATNRVAVGDQLTAKFDGQSYGARAEAGYRYAVMPMVGVTPYAALQAQDFHTPGYSETDLSGGGFGLSYNAVNATDTRTELGARFDDLTMLGAMPLVLRGRLAWAHDWVSNPSLGAVFETLPGASFTVNGATPPKNSALTTAGAELHLTANWTVLAKFDGDFGSGSQTYAGTGTVRYSW